MNYIKKLVFFVVIVTICSILRARNYEKIGIKILDNISKCEHKRKKIPTDIEVSIKNQYWDKMKRRHKSRKDHNKYIHSLEGNKKENNEEQLLSITMSENIINLYWETMKRRHLKRREQNKKTHSLEGNKRRITVNIGWWNNKSAQGQLAKSTKDNIAMVLRKYNLDVLGISEANVKKNDDIHDNKIKGFELINDKILCYGRSRSALYVK